MLDVKKNRKSKKYNRQEMLRRVLWAIVSPLFRFSPRTFFGWRNFLLKLFGAKIGNNVHIYNSAEIYMPWNFVIGAWSSVGERAFIYNLGIIELGDSVTVSHRAHLCAGTHDYQKSDLPLLKLPIKICSEVWLCADSFIGPGVIVGEGAVVGACAVVVDNVEAWTVVAGNPAKKIKMREISPSQ